VKEEALRIVSAETNPRHGKNKLREYLQHVILRQLFEQGFTDVVVFHGGTALRILHGLGRFSEDLDFHLNYPNKDFSLKYYLPKLINGLELSGYSASINKLKEQTVQSVFIKFTGLLFDAGLSPHRDENLSVKIDIDTNPPMGFTIEKTLVNQYFPIGINHQNRESFLAGKLHAILQRQYTKGRDWYDLIFYLSRWKDIAPNLDYLNNALVQSNWQGGELSEETWRNHVVEKLNILDLNKVREDVAPFIETETELAFFETPTIKSLLMVG
jgi:hypothetical protein